MTNFNTNWCMHVEVFSKTRLPSPKIILTVPQSTLLCIMHLQTYLHHSGRDEVIQPFKGHLVVRWVLSREQVLQLTLYEKKSTDCDSAKKKKPKWKSRTQQWHRNFDSLAEIRKINTTKAMLFSATSFYFQ